MNALILEISCLFFVIFYSGGAVVVLVQLEREEEVTGPVIAPLFPQVCFILILFYTLKSVLFIP